MDFETLILIGAGIWALLGWLGDRGRKQRQAPASKAKQPRPRVTASEAERSRPRVTASDAKPSPEEVTWADLGRLLGIEVPGSAGPMGRPARVPLPEAEDVEDGETLEEEPVVVSLEEFSGYGERELVDQDAAAPAIVARRIREAAARNQALSGADHAAFDRRIRTERPVTEVARRWTGLQNAIVWREVLGAPVAYRYLEGSFDDR